MRPSLLQYGSVYVRRANERASADHSIKTTTQSTPLARLGVGSAACCQLYANVVISCAVSRNLTFLNSCSFDTLLSGGSVMCIRQWRFGGTHNIYTPSSADTASFITIEFPLLNSCSTL